MATAGTARFRDPKPGDVVLFRWRGGWRRGIVLEGWRPPGRRPIRKEAPATPREAKAIYWRSESQLFEPFGREFSGI
jgi:hypothetical protein